MGECSQGKLFYFLNNGVKTSSYGLKILKNIEKKYVFDLKANLHPLKTLHTSYLNFFKEKEPKCIVKENIVLKRK